MRDTSHRWMLLLLRGLVAVGLGVVAWLSPVATIATVGIIFGGFALLDGGFALAVVFSVKNPARWVTMLLVESLVSVVAGMVTLLVPNLATVSLAVIVGAWAIATGVLELVTAFRVGDARDGRSLLGVAGVVSILTGLLFMVNGTERGVLVLLAPSPSASASRWPRSACACAGSAPRGSSPRIEPGTERRCESGTRVAEIPAEVRHARPCPRVDRDDEAGRDRPERRFACWPSWRSWTGTASAPCRSSTRSTADWHPDAHLLHRLRMQGELEDLAAGTVMTPYVVWLPPEAPIASAAAAMSAERMHHALVLGDDRRIVGIVSSLDFLRWMAEQAGFEVRPSEHP